MIKKKSKSKAKKSKPYIIILEIILVLIFGPMLFVSPYLLMMGGLALDVLILVPTESISTSITQDIKQYEEDMRLGVLY